MKRELKFRVYNAQYKEMERFELEDICAHGAYVYGIDDVISIEDRPIMQYTGINDKNGVEIYENDIVRDRNNQNWFVVWHRYGWFLHDGKQAIWKDDMSDCELEVIGNICANPELLEDKK